MGRGYAEDYARRVAAIIATAAATGQACPRPPGAEILAKTGQGGAIDRALAPFLKQDHGLVGFDLEILDANRG